MAFSNSPLVLVPVNDVLEVCGRVSGGRRSEPDLYCIEVIKRLAPDRFFRRRVPSMTLVGNHQIEGVNRNVQFGCIFIQLLVPGSENRIPTKQVDGHPLDSADVNKSKTRIWMGQIG